MGLLRQASGALFALTAIASHSTGQTPALTTLYQFQGGKDGALPHSGLVIGAKGALFGTTGEGGGADLGTVFVASSGTPAGAPGQETTIYSFASPAVALYGGGLVMGKNGTLYGVNSGGTAGFVYQLTPPAGTPPIFQQAAVPPPSRYLLRGCNLRLW